MRTLEAIWEDLCKAEKVTQPIATVERLRDEAAQAFLSVIVVAEPVAA